MVVQIRLFAILRELAGTDSIDLELDEGATVADALAALKARGELAEAVGRMSLVMAVNREYARGNHVLKADDELALIPPVSGGAGAAGLLVHVRITDEPLLPEAVARRVGHPGAGAIVTFQGTTRDVKSLEYEAYRPMAEERIDEILKTAVDRYGLLGAATEHRIGEVPRGEPSVVIACSAAHREEAFAGAREVIDRIKEEVPIWKKEVGKDEERWAEGKTPPGGSS